MGVIVELARAKQRIKELEAELALPPTYEEYYEWVRQQVGVIPKHESTLVEVRQELKTLGLVCMDESIPDTRVFSTDEASLTKMIPFLTYPADYYVAELDIDCDDYSMWAAADARKIFKVNGIYQVWGHMPLGYHAWSVGRVAAGKYLLWEPNAGFECAGELFAFGIHEYRPEKWK